MKLTILFIASFLILAVFISGCTQQTGRQAPQPQRVSTTIPQVSQEVAQTQADMDAAIESQLAKLVDEQTEDLTMLERELVT